jgi:anti-sigma factor RsiW
MTCEELIGFLADYLDGDLPPAARRTFEEHLAECTACVEYLRTYRDTIRLGRAACEDAVAGEPPEALVRAVMQARKRRG